MKESFQKELNEVLNRVSHYESLLQLMDENPPADKIDYEIVETLHRAYEQASDVLMKLERKING